MNQLSQPSKWEKPTLAAPGSEPSWSGLLPSGERSLQYALSHGCMHTDSVSDKYGCVTQIIRVFFDLDFEILFYGFKTLCMDMNAYVET